MNQRESIKYAVGFIAFIIILFLLLGYVVYSLLFGSPFRATIFFVTIALFSLDWTSAIILQGVLNIISKLLPNINLSCKRLSFFKLQINNLEFSRIFRNGRKVTFNIALIKIQLQIFEAIRTVGKIKPFRLVIDNFKLEEEVVADYKPSLFSSTPSSTKEAVISKKKKKILSTSIVKPLWASSLIGVQFSDFYFNFKSIGVEVSMEFFSFYVHQIVIQNKTEVAVSLKGFSIKVNEVQNAPDLLAIDDIRLSIIVSLSRTLPIIENVELISSGRFVSTLHLDSLESILEHLVKQNGKLKETVSPVVVKPVAKKGMMNVEDFMDAFDLIPQKAVMSLNNFEVQFCPKSTSTESTSFSSGLSLSINFQTSEENQVRKTIFNFSIDGFYIENLFTLAVFAVSVKVNNKLEGVPIQNVFLECISDVAIDVDIHSPKIIIFNKTVNVISVLYSFSAFSDKFKRAAAKKVSPSIVGIDAEISEPQMARKNSSMYFDFKMYFKLGISSFCTNLTTPMKDSPLTESCQLTWSGLNITSTIPILTQAPYILVSNILTTFHLSKFRIDCGLEAIMIGNADETIGKRISDKRKTTDPDLLAFNSGKMVNIKEILIRYVGCEYDKSGSMTHGVNVDVMYPIFTIEQEKIELCGAQASWIKEQFSFLSKNKSKNNDIKIQTGKDTSVPSLQTPDINKLISINNFYIFVSASGELQPIGFHVKNITFNDSIKEMVKNVTISHIDLFLPNSMSNSIVFHITRIEGMLSDKYSPKQLTVDKVKLLWTPAFTWMCVLIADRLKDAIDLVVSKLEINSSPKTISTINENKSSDNAKNGNLNKLNVAGEDVRVIITSISLVGNFTEESSMAMLFEKVSIAKLVSGAVQLIFLNNKMMADGQDTPLMFAEHFRFVVAPEESQLDGKVINIIFNCSPVFMFLSSKFKFGIIQGDVLSVQKALKTKWRERISSRFRPDIVKDSVASIPTFKADIHFDCIRAVIQDDPNDPKSVENFYLFDMTWMNMNINFIRHFETHCLANLIKQVCLLDSYGKTPIDHGFGDVLGGSVNMKASSVSIKLRNSPYPLMESHNVAVSGLAIFADLNPTPKSTLMLPMQLFKSPGMKANCQFHNVTILKNSCPVKLYHDLQFFGSSLALSHGPYFDFPINAVSDAVELALPASTDPSPNLPFWDKLRYQVHGYINLKANSGKLRICGANIHEEEALELRAENIEISSQKGRVTVNGVKIKLFAILPESYLDLTYKKRNKSRDFAVKTGLAGEKYLEMLVVSTENAEIDITMKWVVATSVFSPDNHYAQMQVAASAPDTFAFFRAKELHLRISVNLPSKGVAPATQLYFCWPVIDFAYAVYDLLMAESPAATPASRAKPKIGSVITTNKFILEAESVGLLFWEKVGSLEGSLAQTDRLFLFILQKKTPSGLMFKDTFRNIYTNMNVFIANRTAEEVDDESIPEWVWKDPPPESFFLGFNHIDMFWGHINDEDAAPSNCEENSNEYAMARDLTLDMHVANTNKVSVMENKAPTYIITDMKFLYTVAARNAIEDFSSTVTSWAKTVSNEKEPEAQPDNLVIKEDLTPIRTVKSSDSLVGMVEFSPRSVGSIDESIMPITPRSQLQQRVTKKTMRRKATVSNTSAPYGESAARDRNASSLDMISESPQLDNKMLDILLMRKDGEEVPTVISAEDSSPLAPTTPTNLTNEVILGTKNINPIMKRRKSTSVISEKYNVIFERAQINMHSPQTKSSILLYISKAKAQSRTTVPKDDNIDMNGRIRVESDYSLEDVDAYVNTNEDDDLSDYFVNWCEHDGTANNYYLQQIMRKSNLNILWVSFDESEMQANNNNRARATSNVVSFDDLAGVSISVPDISLRLRSHAFYQVMNVIRHVLLAPPKGFKDVEQDDAKEAKPSSDFSSTPIGKGSGKELVPIKVASSAIPGLIEILGDDGMPTGMVFDRKLKDKEKESIINSAENVLKNRRERAPIPIYRIDVSASEVKWIFLSEEGHEVAEASVNGIVGNRITNKDGSTLDEIEIESITMINSMHKDSIDEHEFDDNLIFGAIDKGSEQRRRLSGGAARDKTVLLRSHNKPRLSLLDLGIPALNVSDHFEVCLFPSKNYILCVQLSYNVYNRINTYFFPDSELENEVSGSKKKMDVDEVEPYEMKGVILDKTIEKRNSFDSDEIPNIARNSPSPVRKGHKRSSTADAMNSPVIHSGRGSFNATVFDNDLRNKISPTKAIDKDRPVSTTPYKGVNLLTNPEASHSHNKIVNVNALASDSFDFGDDGGFKLIAVSKCIHAFELSNTVKHCDICNKIVHFMRDPGFKCSKCKMNVHPACRRKALGLPPKKKKVKMEKEFILFRYVRFEDVLIKVSAKGFPYIMELNKYDVHLTAFKISKQLWTWEKLIDKVKKSLRSDVLHMAPSLAGKFIMDKINYSSKKKTDKSSEKDKRSDSVLSISTESTTKTEHSRNVSIDSLPTFSNPSSPTSVPISEEREDSFVGEVKAPKLGTDVSSSIKKKLTSYLWKDKS